MANDWFVRVKNADRFFLKLVGGPEYVVLYRFLQVLVVALPIGALVVAHEIKTARIETANQEVRQVVEQAQRWIRDGKLADADELERQLNAAQASAVATDKDSVAPTLSKLQNVKAERQAAQLLASAVDAVALKQFEKSQGLLWKYLADEHATEKKKAETLLADISLATSDEESLKTLLAVDDNSFASFTNGDFHAVVLSQPALTETHIATLKHNLAEATRQREDVRKKVDAAKEAIRRSDERRHRLAETSGQGR